LRGGDLIRLERARRPDPDRFSLHGGYRVGTDFPGTKQSSVERREKFLILLMFYAERGDGQRRRASPLQKTPCRARA
jgi:hypothetical protein